MYDLHCYIEMHLSFGMVLFYVDPCVQTKEVVNLDLTYFDFDLNVPVSKHIIVSD